MAPKNTDEYIARFPEETQVQLQEIRAIIKKAAPKATEVISYGMPGYRQHNMLVWFGGAKMHIGFYPSSGPIVAFADKLEVYQTSKGAIQFPLGKKLPVKLITDIVKYRLAEDNEKAALKTKAKTTARKTAVAKPKAKRSAK